MPRKKKPEIEAKEISFSWSETFDAMKDKLGSNFSSGYLRVRKEKRQTKGTMWPFVGKLYLSEDMDIEDDLLRQCGPGHYRISLTDVTNKRILGVPIFQIEVGDPDEIATANDKSIMRSLHKGDPDESRSSARIRADMNRTDAEIDRLQAEEDLERAQARLDAMRERRAQQKEKSDDTEEAPGMVDFQQYLTSMEERHRGEIENLRKELKLESQIEALRHKLTALEQNRSEPWDIEKITQAALALKSIFAPEGGSDSKDTTSQLIASFTSQVGEVSKVMMTNQLDMIQMVTERLLASSMGNADMDWKGKAVLAGLDKLGKGIDGVVKVNLEKIALEKARALPQPRPQPQQPLPPSQPALKASAADAEAEAEEASDEPEEAFEEAGHEIKELIGHIIPAIGEGKSPGQFAEEYPISEELRDVLIEEVTSREAVVEFLKNLGAEPRLLLYVRTEPASTWIMRYLAVLRTNLAVDTHLAVDIDSLKKEREEAEGEEEVSYAPEESPPS